MSIWTFIFDYDEIFYYALLKKNVVLMELPMPPIRSVVHQFDSLIEAIHKDIANGKPKPTLLLHVCCGPCSSAVIEQLSQVFQITLYYYNPNIYPRAEYERRRDELKAFIQSFPPAMGIGLVVPSYDSAEFYRGIDVEHTPQLKFQPEKQERCRRCYLLRMDKAYEYAADHNFDYITTALSISPHKDSQVINAIGVQLQKKYRIEGHGPHFILADFKKRNGFKRSLEISGEYDLYRQEYCGCVYSMERISAKG